MTAMTDVLWTKGLISCGLTDKHREKAEPRTDRALQGHIQLQRWPG